MYYKSNLKDVGSVLVGDIIEFPGGRRLSVKEVRPGGREGVVILKGPLGVTLFAPKDAKIQVYSR